MKGLKDKKILITAGPTQVAIDPVRVITNISTGKTGQLIARQAARCGADVHLLLSRDLKQERIKGIKIRHFRFFNQLRSLIQEEIKKNNFDFIIHNAAVSDFLVKRQSRQKIDSSLKKLRIELVRAPKIIKEIRRRCPRSLLVMFKLEVNSSLKQLIKKARLAQKAAGADIVVANTFKKDTLKSFVFNHKGMLTKADSRQMLAKRLVSILETTVSKVK
ncbi:MAG: phosphopantothenoylcysteine decarboxylase [Candidatus Omnitrophica bacterium]|nr:phosphopantothenoylcysteine decarboxylase [Candidatus Omnitrophota bacterium]